MLWLGVDSPAKPVDLRVLVQVVAVLADPLEQHEDAEVVPPSAVQGREVPLAYLLPVLPLLLLLPLLQALQLLLVFHLLQPVSPPLGEMPRTREMHPHRHLFGR